MGCDPMRGRGRICLDQESLSSACAGSRRAHWCASENENPRGAGIALRAMPPFRPLSSRLAPAARPLGSEGLLCTVPGITERLNLFKFKRRLAAHLAMHHRRTRPRVGNVKELDVRVVQPSRVNLLGEASPVRAPQPRDVFPKRCDRHAWLVREPATSGHLAHTSSGPGHSLQVSGRSTPVRVVPPCRHRGGGGSVGNPRYDPHARSVPFLLPLPR